MSINEEKLNQLLGKFIGDLGATIHSGSVVIGAELGLYKAMAAVAEPINSEQLAAKTDTNERYVREWLNAQAASGYVEYDATTEKYFPFLLCRSTIYM